MTAAHTPARDPRNWRTEHALMQATIDARRELARATARIAPAPTGSREIPRWLLAVLFVLTVAAIATFAPGARAAEPLNWQADQETFWQWGFDHPAGWNDEIIVAGYRYDWPGTAPIDVPPVVTPHTPAVPEPASWMMFAAGGIVLVIARRRLRAGGRA